MATTEAGVATNALELAIERLEIKLEHDSFAGPGERSYSDEDVDAIQEEINALQQLASDLNSGDLKLLVLTKEEHQLICGMVQPTSDIDSDGVCANHEVWEGVREKFPLSDFPMDADPDDGNPPVYYHGELC